MINLDEVRNGDVITLSDEAGNRARGRATHAGSRLTVAIFGDEVTFARAGRGGVMHVVHGLTLLDHQASLFIDQSGHYPPPGDWPESA